MIAGKASWYANGWPATSLSVRSNSGPRAAHCARGRVYAVPVTSSNGLFKAGKPVPLFTANVPTSNAVRYWYAVSRDGRRILTDIEAEQENHSVELLIHWDAALK